MISGTTATTTSCFQNLSQATLKSYSVPEDMDSSSLQTSQSGPPPPPACPSNNALILYSVSFLKEKVHQLQSLVTTTILVSPPPPPPDQHPNHQPESTSIAAMADMSSLVQEIILTASSLIVTCQQMTPSPDSTTNEILLQQQQHIDHDSNQERSSGQGFYFSEAFDTWYGDNDNNDYVNNNNNNNCVDAHVVRDNKKGELLLADIGCDIIIQLDAADLLAKYTHYCQVCGKGFKRDANLRMHMRAHGDEYKTSAALTNPLKKGIIGNSMGGSSNDENAIKVTRKYSCPQEGCRWNKKHVKFQPLKSMICAKNHYKRSHCPKMYVCKRCNRKQFSVLSDLRTHEKHCGDSKWQCSCGTTFSRKDKLLGHVALFVGHTPAINVVASTTKTAKMGNQLVAPMQLDD